MLFRSLCFYGSAGPADVRLFQSLELAPGDNSWSRDLPAGTVVLTGIPPFEPRRRDREAPEFCLLWRDDPALVWEGSLYDGGGATLTIPDVPAGHLCLVRRPEQPITRYADESWPLVLEFELVAGTVATVQFP